MSDSALPEGEADLRVVPIHAMEGLPADSGVPVIAYGPGGSLRRAYLDGCADYLKEPWTPEELGFRALAVLERARHRYLFPWGEIGFEDQNLVTPAGPVALTYRESRILRLLILHRGSPVPRAALAYQGWGSPLSAGSRRIDAHVAAIRRKVKVAIPRAGRFIVAVRREGYMVP